MAKIQKLKAKSTASDEVEEILDDVQEEVQEINEVAESPKEFKMVKVAVNQEVSPAPRVGNIDMVREFGLSKLVPGVIEVPEPVAIVLVDKKLASYV